MTSEEFTKRLPRLTDNPLPLKPPFVFNGLTASVFPLRASLEALQELCNGYLNIIPPEVGHFRPAGPYVNLMLLDYGQLTESVSRIGWFSQVEVFFGVTVEWYKRVNGRWVFHDWAVITPYIFVDDEMSVPLGRSVYGFPKALAKVSRISNDWIKNPMSPLKLVQLETAVFPEAYAGSKLQTRVFLEVERTAPQPGLQIPLDLHSPMMPWRIASNLAAAAGGFGRDAMRMAQALRVFPLTPVDFPGILQGMGRKLAEALPPWGKGMVQNSLNLKQFRRSNDTTNISYQAITNGKMVASSFNGGGLLGGDRTLLGDLSGGHTVRLYEHSSLPIARVLGLEVYESRQSEGISVADLRPVMPFWMNVDIGYEQATNLAWRGADGIWKDAAGTPFDPEQEPATEANAPPFNLSAPSSLEAVSGPFQFSGATIRVLPMLAQKEKMQGFLDSYINSALQGPDNPMVDLDGNAQRVRLQVWTRPPIAVNSGLPIGGAFGHVYLTATSYANVTSKTNNVGDWANYEVSFMIPVTFQRQKADETWETMGVGLVPAYNFVDTCIASISRTEIQGINTTTGTFVRPESVWLGDTADDSRLDPRQTLLRVDAEVFPAVDAGQQTGVYPVLEIRSREPNAGLDPNESRDAAWEWAEALRLEQGTKNSTKIQRPNALKIARALSLELLGNRMPFSIYALKQFRDITDPDKACYQSLVRVPRSFREVHDLREIEETLVVQIQDYPNLKIVETLGLVAQKQPKAATGLVYKAQAVRPFYVRATVDEDLSERLASRTGTNLWTLDHKVSFATLLSDAEGSPVITADYRAETLQDQMDPCRMSSIMFQAAQRLRFDTARRLQEGTPAIDRSDARCALAKIDPQMVIDSILSREWGNTGDDARWRCGRSQLMKATAALPVSGRVKPFAESVLYRKFNNALASLPGAVASRLKHEEAFYENIDKAIEWLSKARPGNTEADRWALEMERIIAKQEKFERLRVAMEERVNVLAAFEILGMRGMENAYKCAGTTAPKESDIEALGILLREARKFSEAKDLNVDLRHIANDVKAALEERAPNQTELFATGDELVKILAQISQLNIEGEPSNSNNLDTGVTAVQTRLRELIAAIPAWQTKAEALEGGRAMGEQFRQMVELARTFCDAQVQALMNKLSRAYQKPDFCIRRDSVGADNLRLLPLALSWDQDWYFGNRIEQLLDSTLLQVPGMNAEDCPPPMDVSEPTPEGTDEPLPPGEVDGVTYCGGKGTNG